MKRGTQQGAGGIVSKQLGALVIMHGRRRQVDMTDKKAAADAAAAAVTLHLLRPCQNNVNRNERVGNTDNY